MTDHPACGFLGAFTIPRNLPCSLLNMVIRRSASANGVFLSIMPVAKYVLGLGIFTFPDDLVELYLELYRPSTLMIRRLAGLSLET